MLQMNLRVNVGSVLRPEDFPTLEFIEAKVEEAISLVLQTVFEFAQTEVTNIDEDQDPDETSLDGPNLPEDLTGEQDIPDDLW